MYILLHSSKTMRDSKSGYTPLGRPSLIRRAHELRTVWHAASQSDIQKQMHISEQKAEDVKEMYKTWSDNDHLQVPAIDIFKGDIYSGLQVHDWTDEDRIYAQKHLLILSGLYGVLRACDGIVPYRLEMGYRLPDGRNMYDFWSDSIAKLIPSNQPILNLSAVEYTKAILPYIDTIVIAPKFLTLNPKTNQPVFVAVHAKIARGAFARWVIQNRIQYASELKNFAELGYAYDAKTSTPHQPVFVCQKFEGLGLSVRTR
ncbi:MAG: YaaA family protein [Candidatus Microsaccharimonas sp.]